MGKSLSLKKVTDFMAKNSVILSSLYCERGSKQCLFIECRTPVHQKTFVVAIPSKYTLSIPDDEPTHRLMITPVDRDGSRQEVYMRDIRGGSAVNLIALSSTTLCALSSDKSTYYVIGETRQEDTDDASEEVVDEVRELEIAAANLVKKVDHSSEPVEKDVVSPLELSGDASSPEEISQEEISTDEIVGEEQLVFDDEPAQEIQSETPPEIEQVIDNSVPPTLEDSEVEIGLVYVLIDISTFFKGAPTLESGLVSSYAKLDANEVNMRKRRMLSIEDKAKRVHDYTVERLAEITIKETALRKQLARLTQVLAKTEALKSKADKFTEIATSVDEVYGKTRRSIHELNVQYLRLRDEADRMLTSYEDAFDELTS